MQTSSFRLVRCAVAYLLGAFLIGWGLWCFGYELLYPAQVARESEAANGTLVVYAPSMFAGVIIYLGIVLFLMPRFDFVSGILILLGSILAGFAMIFLAYSLGDSWGRVPLARYLPVIAILGFLFLLGCSGVVAGVIWYRRKRKSPPNTALEPTPTAP